VYFFWQNTSDLSDLVSSGRDRKPEEVAFAEECELKSMVFRAQRYGSSYLLCFPAHFLSSSSNFGCHI